MPPRSVCKKAYASASASAAAVRTRAFASSARAMFSAMRERNNLFFFAIAYLLRAKFEAGSARPIFCFKGARKDGLRPFLPR